MTDINTLVNVDGIIKVSGGICTLPDGSTFNLNDALNQMQNDLSDVRNSARSILHELGWARGQFGSIIVASNFVDCADKKNNSFSLAQAGYDRMNVSIGDRMIRDQLYTIDESIGNYIPR